MWFGRVGAGGELLGILGGCFRWLGSLSVAVWPGSVELAPPSHHVATSRAGGCNAPTTCPRDRPWLGVFGGGDSPIRKELARTTPTAPSAHPQGGDQGVGSGSSRHRSRQRSDRERRTRDPHPAPPLDTAPATATGGRGPTHRGAPSRKRPPSKRLPAKAIATHVGQAKAPRQTTLAAPFCDLAR